jgi:hypothetical protein
VVEPLTIEELEDMHAGLRQAFNIMGERVGYGDNDNIQIAAFAAAATALIEADRYLLEKKEVNNNPRRLDK